MKRFLFGLLIATPLMGQTASVRGELNVNEIVSQLGLCNANLVLDQKFVKALQAENLELRKKVSALDGTEVPKGSK